MDEKFRSRKFLITLGVFLSATALLVGGYIDDIIWRDVAIATNAAYLVSQAYIDRSSK